MHREIGDCRDRIMDFPQGVTGASIYDMLVYYYHYNAIIPQVYVRDTEAADLVGVRIVTLGLDIVIFEQVTSPGVGLFMVRIDDIVAMDLPS